MSKITAYKAFNADWTCRDFQYEVDKTYSMDGDAEICERGFHACLNPIDCFQYYPPTGKLAVVEFPEITGEDVDTKVCGVEIHIKAEMSLPDFIADGVKYILSKVDCSGAKETNTGSRSAATNTGSRSAATNTGIQSAATNTGSRSAATNTGDRSAATNTGDRSAATNTGDRSAATNTGYQSAATNTGDRSAATNTGDRSAATNTGYQSAATNTGYQSAATNTGIQSAAKVEGQNSHAIATGIQGKAAASEGSAIYLAEYDADGTLIANFAGIAGRDGIKPDTFYTLKGGKPVEAS
ncbi:DUF7666 domain-containing protein [Roseovarius sp.]